MVVPALTGIKFVYDEPALIAEIDGKGHLVIGDLHIGMELALSRKGVHMFSATERMARRIKGIMDEFSIRDVVILGDVKESILYPDAVEAKLLRQFFSDLDCFDLHIIAGNHDAHLEDIIDKRVERELVLGRFGFIHGNRKPSGQMMELDYIISAHEHLAVRIRERNGAMYEQKAWAIYNVSKKTAKESYGSFNKRIRLISMPAFNELILGTTVEKGKKSRMNPLLTNGVFTSRNWEVYNLMGQRIML